ncbi:MAG: hypothetical protein EXS35_14580 [Pedosphaera sp.]|nr:hypothetical protein [Pedosphaera sp.]
MKSLTEMPRRGLRKRTEQGYVRSALIALRRLGIPCAWEAALLGRSVDLALFHGNALWTVEFKKRDWRKALEQARDHLLGADFAYVCLAERKPSEACLEAARDAGVGVLRLRNGNGWPFEVVKKAPRSAEVWQVARDRLIGQLKTA